MQDYLKKMKEEYESVTPTPYLQQNGWIEIHQKMEDRRIETSWGRLMRLSFLMLLLLIPVSGTLGLIKAANAAAPETPLYPVKLAIEQVYEKITGSNDLAIRHRAEEITQLSKQEDKSEILEKVVGEYTEDVEKEKRKTEEKEKEEKKKELEENLREHRRQFNEAVKGNPLAKQQVEKAIEATGNSNNNGNNGSTEENGNPPEVRGKSDEAPGKNEYKENRGKSEERGRKKR